jgi:hypothetical protein
LHAARLINRRCLVAAAATLAALAAATVPAGAATTTKPSHGRATSTLTILKLSIAGERVTAGQIVAAAGNAATPHVAKLVVTPLSSSLTGALGQCTLTASGTTCAGGGTIPATPKSVALPNGLGTVVGPRFVAEAKDTASGVLVTAKLAALGKVTLDGVPLSLRLASLGDVAKVLAGNATAQKSFSLGDLSLPSLSQLLSSLGLDLDKTLDQLTQGKLTQLASLVTSTTTGAVHTANAAVDTAQAALANAGQTPASSVVQALADLADAQQGVTDADTAFAAAWNSAFGALPGPAQTLVTGALTAAGITGVPTPADMTSTLLATLQPLFDAVDTTLWPTITSALQGVADAQQVVSLVNDLVDSLQQLVTSVVDKLATDGDPIAALGGIKLTTKAIAAGTPSADAALSVASIDVLGHATSLSQLGAAVSTVGATLSSVLNSIPGVTFTPPSIALGTPSKSTHTQGHTRYAAAAVRGLTLTLPTLAVSGNASPLAPNGVTSGAGSLVLGELTESAQWTPAASTTTTASGSPAPNTPGGPQLGDTGGRVLLPIVATALIGVAAMARRRWGHA